MSNAAEADYLARVEANIVGVQAAPNAVFLRLSRAFAGESRLTCMFTEMTPGQVVRLIRDLQTAVREAVAAAD